MPVNRWHPETGELGVFEHAHEAPADWLSKHPNDPNYIKPELVKDSVVRMERADIVEALNAGGFEFKKNAPTAALYAQFRERLVAHLTETGVEFDPEADARTLLGLVTPEA